MKITKLQTKLLHIGLTQSVTNEEKWKVIMMVIIPQIIGEELVQEGITWEKKPYRKKQKIEEVVICEDRVILTHRKFWEANQYHGSSLCHVGSFSFEFKSARPILEGNKLLLGFSSGWGDEWHILLTQ